ncbi:MAG: Eco57I restriction-modification methylase domain-containing protein [Pyrinomonadaceae bacterium]
MLQTRTEQIKEFLQKIKNASKELTKKEAFKDLLNRLYAENEETRNVIDAISSGAERAILNIPRKDKVYRGSADTLYNKIIIEFENDLKKTLKHAKEQLAGYLLGQFNSGEGYNYTLIASDFISWKVFAPDVSQLEIIETLKEDELILNEIESSSFTLTEHNTEEFFYWIDRFLFKEEKQKATLKGIEEAFGYQSHVFIQGFRELTKHFREVREKSEVRVLYEQWKKFLSIAYGSFEDTEGKFLIHTYLSIFSKMLAYTVVSNDDYIDDGEMKSIVDGTIFQKLNIANFVENDFFHWVKTDVSFRALKKVFRRIAQELSMFDFQNVHEDILKGVYQELIDLDTRHALGEYYTPDWLCERVAAEFNFTETDKILDPSCGSGSFLRAAISRIKFLNPNTKIENLNEQIYGIDIHPLSVQIAKTTLLLAFGKAVTHAKKPVHLNIILANTLLAPQGVTDMFGSQFMMQIDNENYPLTTRIFGDVALFDRALDLCEELAEQTRNKADEQLATFTNILRSQNRNAEISDEIAESFYQIYRGLKQVKENGRDSIWHFIVQNLYKPYFLAAKFDYVIGNPPWFTYSSIKNEGYQDILNKLAKEHDVKPLRQANFPHLEIAAIFLAYCSGYFLKTNGRLAFVLPRSFFSADHHDNTRSGRAKGFSLTNLWDLDKVSPLFRIPSCVLFAAKNVEQGRNTHEVSLSSDSEMRPYSVRASAFDGKIFSGKLKTHNSNWLEAEAKLSETETNFYYVRQGNSTAFSEREQTATSQPNPYKNEFKNGATIFPQAFYFVELNQTLPPDFDEDRIINARTSTILDKKEPWKDFELRGRIECKFLFRTALSKSLLPFAFQNPDLIILPATIETRAEAKRIKLHTAEELRREGFLNASRWFDEVEKIWEERRTEKNRKISATNYLNWQNKLTDQNLNLPYLVLYNKSAKDANSTIVKRSEIDLEFVVENKAYSFATYNLDEAHYLTAILNATFVNESMKDFQTKGLFGARDVSSKILDVYFPRFSASDSRHLQLARLSETCHRQAREFLQTVAPMNLGRLRLAVKEYLKDEMTAIDEIVSQLLA